MRLFIGIEMPGEVKRALGGIQHSKADIRWAPPERLHLTLRFIGEAGEGIRDRLIASLGHIEIGRFELNISGIGFFPQGEYPKVIWAGIEENKKLLNFQEEIEKRCRSMGLEAEERTFIPHITIGRVQGASKKEILVYINRHKQLRIGHISVEEFVLFESILCADGAIHTPVHRFQLKID